jgi:hypothetical protein
LSNYTGKDLTGFPHGAIQHVTEGKKVGYLVFGRKLY